MNQHLHHDLKRAIASEHYDITEQGVAFPAQSALISGEYFWRVNDGEVEHHKNLITTEGLAHVLNVAMGATPKPSAYYLALFNGSATPQASWNAASFSAVAGEITSQAEGYTSATRPVWTPATANGGSIDNIGKGSDDLSSAAKVTIATASQLNVTGIALLTASAKGATTGVLVSAFKMPLARTLQNGDTFFIGYRFSLTV